MMPLSLKPMLATAGALPEESAGWAFEFKWDGVRAISYVSDGAVRVVSRNDRDVSTSYPELQQLANLADPCVLDGEIVSLDRAGRPSFGELQFRMHVRQPDKQLLTRVPVAYYAFDVLHIGDESLLKLPYAHRRQRLDQIDLAGRRSVLVPPCFTDVDGQDVLQAAADQGLEGVVAKRVSSVYEPGRRSGSWIKVPLSRTQEVVIGGWKPGEGRRAGTIGSLLLGAYDETGLRYVGHVGTGFTEAMLHDLQHRLEPLHRRTPAFSDEIPRDRARGARWTDPLLVGEVEYRTWTRDGRMRHPSWRGLRADKAPAEARVDRERDQAGG